MHGGRNSPRASLKVSLWWKNFPPRQSERGAMVEEFPLARVPSIRSMAEEFPPSAELESEPVLLGTYRGKRRLLAAGFHAQHVTTT